MKRLLVSVISALIIAGAGVSQKNLTGPEESAVSRALAGSVALVDKCPCPEVLDGLITAAGAKFGTKKLARKVPIVTVADEIIKGPPDEWVFTEPHDNTIAFSPKRVEQATSQFQWGMSGETMNDLLMGGLMFAETGHFDTTTRLDKDGNALPDPAGTPNPKTAAQNKKCQDDSEIEVADRLVVYVDWLVGCSMTIIEGQLAIEISAKDRALLDRWREVGVKQRKRHGG